MSGIVGHTTYALLGLQAAHHLPIAPVLHRHLSSYLAGAYLGSDIQIVPAATCVESGREIGCCSMTFDRCPETGEAVRPWRLNHGGQSYSGQEIHDIFYGRAHLIFGYAPPDAAALTVPWDHAASYFAAAVDDTLDLFPPSERSLAYVFGWMVHVATDSLIKSFIPGIQMKLLDGTYTPRNRPIQDLYCFHEAGGKQMKLPWPALLHDLATSPVEPVQAHYMRIGEPRGKLAKLFPGGWDASPERRALLFAVLRENRRYTPQHAREEVQSLRLEKGEAGAALQAKTGLNYAGMMAAAVEAGYPRALQVMAQRVSGLFADVLRRCPRLAVFGAVRIVP
jgi:hypothetical protein